VLICLGPQGPPTMRPAAGKAQAAAVQAARQASAVFKAIVQGPQAPAPAAWGVEVTEFQRALPWLRWKELVAFANHFGQRGAVRQEIAAELAAEIRRRMVPEGAAAGPASAAGSQGEPSGPSAAARAMASRSAQDPREVVAVVYSFSKIVPQSPEYLPIYAGVAHGIQQGAWKFSRLQAALVGTALADVGHHLADALPAVLRPLLRGLCEDGSECSQVNINELRYILHACVMLPRPGLAVEEMEALGSCTRRLAGEATFAAAAHLMVSWLQLRPPAAAKRVHQDALRALGSQLSSLTPQNPAHPLPAAGLAPAIADLLARERERAPPPLTPPQLRDVVQSLVRISRGLRSEAACRSRSLSVGDWTEIAWLVAEFCEAHGSASTAEDGLASTRPLPGWAAEVLGFVFSRAHQYTPQGPPSADLDTVLSLLRLLRRYRPHSPPGRSFFTWAKQRLIEHYEAGRADPAALAEAVSELVPRLPEDERSQLARILLRGAPVLVGPRPPLLAEAAAQPTSSRLLSREAAARHQVAPGITLTDSPLRTAAPAVRHRATGKGLWGLLAQDAPTPQLEVAREPAWERQAAAVEAESDAATVPFAAAGADVPHARTADVASSPTPTARVPDEASSPTPTTRVPDEAGEVAGDVRELQRRLERALERVEALEQRVEESEQRREAEDSGPMDLMPGSSMGQGPAFSGWEPTSLFPGGMGTAGSLDTMPGTAGGGHGTSSAMYLHRPFNFEEFRRAESRRLQSERIRVLVPHDHFPMWPLHKK